MRTLFRQPLLYVVSAVLILGAIAFSLWYVGYFTGAPWRPVVREIPSQFELTPTKGDATGIATDTAFRLTSTTDLSQASIEHSLQIEPIVAVTVKKVSSSSSIFDITPTAPLEENIIYTIAIAEGPIADRSYRWAYQVKAPFVVLATLPRDKARDVPTNTIIEMTFNRENLERPQEFFTLAPEVPGRFEVHRDTLTFIPSKELESRTLYTVTIKKGLQTIGSDEILSEDKTFRFETGDGAERPSRPSLYLHRTFSEFPPTAEPALSVSASGFPEGKKFPLTVYRFANVDEFMTTYAGTQQEGNQWTRYHRTRLVTSPQEKKVLSAEVALEESQYLQFLRIPQALPEGSYLAEITANDERFQTWFQVASLGNFSAVSGTKTMLWVKDVTNGSNVIDASVLFAGQVVGTTNADGVALFDTPPSLLAASDASPYWESRTAAQSFFVVAAGERRLAIPIEDEYGTFAKVPRPDPFWDYLSVDKTVYLPTDTLRFWGIVKERGGGIFSQKELTVQLTNSFWGYGSEDRTVYGEAKVRVSNVSTVTSEISFRDMKPGLYQLSMLQEGELVTTRSVRIETYLKPAYKLTLLPNKRALFAGDSITYAVKAEFFDGTPVASAAMKWNGYSVSPSEGLVTLNANGEGSFTVGTTYNEEDFRSGPRYVGMHLSPVVAEEGEIDADVSVLLFGPRFHIRADRSSFTDLTKTQTITATVRNVVLEKVERGEPSWYTENYLGAPEPNVAVTAEVRERLYHKREIEKRYDPIAKVTTPVYQYSEERRLLKTIPLVTDGKGMVSLTWTPEEKKTYTIRLIARDENGRMTDDDVWLFGGGGEAFDTRWFSLKNIDDKTDYRLGERFHLEMQDNREQRLPTGDDRFLFLTITDGMTSAQKSNTASFEETFREEFIPNLTVIGVWFNGFRFYNSWPTSISFDASERQLAVEVKTDKERYRPRDKVTLSLYVTDKNGKPREAEVNVAGIDEAVFTLNPEEQDIVNEVYRDRFPWVLMRSSHESPLEPQAERGGGGGQEIRTDFRDVAIYQSVRTGSNGRAEVSFDVPDNLTSWRLTVQAVTGDLFVGKTVTFVPVGLPFFVDASLNRTYLAGDELTLRLRTFGTAIVTKDIVYTIESKTFPWKKIEKTGGNVLEVSLGSMPEGKHTVTITASAGSYRDAIVRDVTVVPSYFVQPTSRLHVLSPDLTIAGASKGWTTLTFSSFERGRWYTILRSIAEGSGARIDQTVARTLAQRMLDRFFGEHHDVADDVQPYQLPTGGIALFPYSDADLTLSALFAHLAKDEDISFTKESLRSYLRDALRDSTTDVHRLARALFGLSAFREPVLVTLEQLAKEQELTVMDRLYIALAFDALGAEVQARTIYREQILPTLKRQQPFVFVDTLRTRDENILATTLLAALATSLHEEEARGLAQYALEYEPKETLKNFEMLFFLKKHLPNLKGGEVRFSYATSRQNESKTLKDTETFSLTLSPEDLASLRFSDIQGSVGVVASFEQASSPEAIHKDDHLKLRRSYSVNGNTKNTFREGDLVRIDVTPTIDVEAHDGAYQIVDYLPSGLRAVTNMQRTPLESGVYSHVFPSQIEDQKITFLVWKDKNATRQFFYYARVVSKGTYKAEPALIQSLMSLESMNVSNGETITIQ